MPRKRKSKKSKKSGKKQQTVREFFGRSRKPTKQEQLRRFLEGKQSGNLTLNLTTNRLGRRSTYFTRDSRLRERFANLPIRTMGQGAIIVPQGETLRVGGYIRYSYFLKSDPNEIITVREPLPRMIAVGANFRREAMKVISRMINSPHTLVGTPKIDGILEYPGSRQPLNIRNIRLREARPFEIDGINPKVKWNKNDGKCVPDFFRHFAPDCDMFNYAKQHSKHRGDDWWKDPFDELCEGGWEEDGIALQHIIRICDFNKVNFCFVDFDMQLIDCEFGYPESKTPTLYAVIKDAHIFPITDPKIKQSIRTRINSRSGGHVPEKPLKESGIKEYIVLQRETERSSLAQVVDIMLESGKQPRAKNIKSDSHHGIKSFVIDDKFYSFLGENNRPLYDVLTEQGQDYAGQEVSSLVSKYFKKYESKITESTKKTYYSEFNPTVQSYFEREGVKNITHRGLAECFQGVEDPFKNTKTYDIRKCHTSILKHPAEPFCKFTLNDNWEKFDKSFYEKNGELRRGFYHVETDDTWMLAGSKCYTAYVVERALESEYITLDDIKMQLIAKKTIPKDYFKNFIEKFVVDMLEEEYNLTLESEKGKRLYKAINNTLSGFLGRNNHNTMRKRLTTQFDEAVDFITKRQEGEEFNIVKVDHEKINAYYVTLTFSRWMERNYLPVYLQILGEQSVMLHDYTLRLTDGVAEKIVHRYIDCVTVKDDGRDTSDILSDVEGGLREESGPPGRIMTNCYSKVSLTNKEINDLVYNDDWQIHESIKSSLDVQEYIECIKAQMSLLTSAFAGAGKSRIIDALSKQFKLLRITPTNISARNIGGDTLHAKFAYKDSDNQLSARKVQSVIDENYDAIILDEVQWFQGCHLLRLLEVVKLAKKPVLGFGDFKQLGNVEGIIYQHSQPMKELFGNRMTNELQWHDKCRLDWTFTNIIQGFREWQENVDEHRKSVYDQFQTVGCCSFTELAEMAMNFVWTNKTRKRLNREINHVRYRKSGSFWQLPYNEDAGPEWRDLVVHKDMPVMVARRNAESNYVDAKQSEYGFVVSWDTDSIYVGIKDKTVECPVERFHYEFIPCYAATVHKMTGETIEGNIAIHEWQRIDDSRWHYTGLTRVRHKENVFTVI